MVNCAEKAQHLWRCFTHNIPYPRVACTIVWQPWAIKSATPTALKHVFFDTLHFFLQHESLECFAKITIISNVNPNNL